MKKEMSGVNCHHASSIMASVIIVVVNNFSKIADIANW